MYDYMRALEDRFNSKAKADPQRQELEAKRQEVAALLDKAGRKKLLRLIDTHTMAQEETALSSFIAGFRLAWGIAMELASDAPSSEPSSRNHGKLYGPGDVSKNQITNQKI